MWTPLRSSSSNSNGEPTDEPKSKNSGWSLFWLLLLLFGFVFYKVAPYIPYGWYAPNPNGRFFMGFNVG